jgi:hypothetical protein
VHSTRVCVAFLVLACLGMTACGDSDDQRAAKATVSGFYGALKAHDAKTACELVSPAVADQILRASGEAGKPCVRGLGDVFTRVARSANPRYFDSPPTVVAALVSGNHATVTIRRGLQRRRLSLTRSANGWRITGSPNVR